MMSPLLHLLLLFSCILSATSITFRCTTRPKCQGMIGYISPNTTTLSSIKDLFGLESVYSLLAANSWPTKDTNRSIAAGSTVRIPFPCSCSNGTGISDRTPVYSVKEGDNLDDIARTIFREFVTYKEIAAVNKISDVNLIDIGQKLWIPLPCSCDDVDAARVVHYGHVVANESWVSEIAGAFGTTEATLMGLNNETLSDPNNLQAGQILDVPIKACNSSTVSSLLVPNGSYALTANNCVQCSCNSNHLGLKCMRAEGVPVTNWAECPSTHCGNLSLGESVDLTTCLHTTCDYAGYYERGILTVLTNQSTCTSAVSGAIGLFIACIVIVLLIKRFWKRTDDSNNNVKASSLRQRPMKNVKAFLQNYGSLAPKQFRYSELKKMTDSFKDKLGEGGYGGVFKGKLKDGRLVAVKSDVYSYGMMVLEMVGGRRNNDAQAEKTSEIYFPHWVYNHIALEDSINLIGIVEEEEKEIARKMVLVGLWCIQTDPTNRPSMSRVVEMLEGSVHSLEMPPKPYPSSP
ncbi:lysM domain-containing protein [Cinnamomum micranthum f. kanehirae]|uniref:LysM domain-containing protein n=1 Tax=Cinnamomum micranthum f. kanehirae TaxID=337451 RepID=A0A443P1A8_9MAGN|nr:lysM domain-containing protein [Cinnamomum micranthum f. kanehirae]